MFLVRILNYRLLRFHRILQEPPIDSLHFQNIPTVSILALEIRVQLEVYPIAAHHVIRTDNLALDIVLLALRE